MAKSLPSIKYPIGRSPAVSCWTGAAKTAVTVLLILGSVCLSVELAKCKEPLLVGSSLEYLSVPSLVDLGIVSDERLTIATLPIKNASDFPMRLVKTVSSCNCLIVSEPDKSELGPGEETTLQASFKPSTARGKKEIEVIVVAERTLGSKREQLLARAQIVMNWQPLVQILDGNGIFSPATADCGQIDARIKLDVDPQFDVLRAQAPEWLEVDLQRSKEAPRLWYMSITVKVGMLKSGEHSAAVSLLGTASQVLTTIPVFCKIL